MHPTRFPSDFGAPPFPKSPPAIPPPAPKPRPPAKPPPTSALLSRAMECHDPASPKGDSLLEVLRWAAETPPITA
eukprot:4987048-Pyramimonas_sp.AAC.1